jgi:hypothetical protein
MDRLEQALREDAARIDATVSPELDKRIRASLESVSQEKSLRARHEQTRTFWWASSLTGLAAALGIIALINLWPSASAPVSEPQTVAGPDSVPPMMPLLKTESAMLTAPLERELDDLESDLETARKVVREDLGF